MRGGFVACLAPSGPTESRLEAIVARLKWHHGKPSLHRLGGLQVACLVDDVHGPAVEVGSGRLLLGHGVPPEPLELLRRRDRFVGLESDGLCLRAVRDPMGEVPLFYRRVGDQFWLATEMHPLLAIAPAEPDLEWLAAFTAMLEYPDTTGWLGVKRVLPGEILAVDRDLQASSSRYFRPSVGPRRGGVAPAAAARRFRELFSIAVAKRCSEHCGVLLSGGLDSSAVAVVAAQTTRPTLLTVSHPELPQVDEIGYAQAAADASGIPLTRLDVEPDVWNPADDIEMFGAPPLAVPTDVYGRGLRALAVAGCDVALDGHDGDGTLGSVHAWTANTLLDARPDRLFRAARKYGPAVVARQTVKDSVPPAVWGRLQRPAAPNLEASLPSYFRGLTAARLADEDRWQRPRGGWEHAQLAALLPPTTQFFEEMELFAARSGIDIQHPFADRSLIDFVITLPHAVKTSTIRLKPVLRDALADLLPPAVFERDDKTAFTAVLDARVDFEACYRWVRDSGVRIPDIDYGRLFRDALKPVNSRVFWTRLATAHIFLAGVARE